MTESPQAVPEEHSDSPAFPTIAFVALGSNLGDPLQQVSSAVEEIAAIPNTELQAQSHWYRSTPMGPQNQPDFINGVIKITTSLSPLLLLDELQQLEHKHRRRKDYHWGPRTLDLDILLFGQQVIDTDRLQIPHPGIFQRHFVLLPLNDIEPNLSFPDGSTLAEHLENISTAGIVRIDTNNPNITHD